LNVQRLQRNIELNTFAANIVPIQAAVVEKQSRVRFLVHASTSMGKAAGSAGREEVYKDEIEVNGISLDNFIFQQQHPKPDAVKMDIEGGEVLAMQGMPRLLDEIRPLLLIELHGGLQYIATARLRAAFLGGTSHPNPFRARVGLEIIRGGDATREMKGM
jgi:FkbM family methyltransferase